jgi:hypothetical protein
MQYLNILKFIRAITPDKIGENLFIWLIFLITKNNKPKFIIVKILDCSFSNNESSTKY